MFHIKGWVKNSFCDWERKISTVLFLPGCNFRCPFCQNWRLVSSPDGFQDIPWQEIERYLREYREFLDGVTVTGGEPFFSPFINDLLEMLRSIGLPVKVDTNGTFPLKLEKALSDNLVSGVSMDVKTFFDVSAYSAVSGVNIDERVMGDIKKSVRILMGSSIEYEFRTTVVRTFHTSSEIKAIARDLVGARRYVLQGYRPSGVNPAFEGGTPYTPAELDEMRAMVASYFQECCVRHYGILS